MKTKFTPFFVGAITAGLLFSSAVAISGPHNNNAENRKAFIQSLNLTDEQREQMRDLMPAMGKQARSNPMRVLMPIAFTDEVDALKLSLTLDALSAQRRAKGLAMAERRFEIRQILDDAQRATLEARFSERMQSANKERDPARLFNKLELTEAQQADIDTLLNSMAESRERMQVLMRSFKTAERDIIQDDAFSSDAWLALYDLHAAELRTNASQLVTTLNAIYNTLDSEQQAKMKRMIKRKMKHMRSKA